MSISKEDYNDVKGAYGKALARKVARATRDHIGSSIKQAVKTKQTYDVTKDKALDKYNRASEDIAQGKFRKLNYTSDSSKSSLPGTPISARAEKSGTTHHFKPGRP